MRDHAWIRSTGLVAALVAVVVASTACGMRPTRFTNPRFDFGFVQRVAVLPLVNLAEDQQAGPRATRILITQLLATEAVEVVEPGEVAAAMNRVAGGSRTPDTDQVIALGEALDVQAIIHGSVTQSENLRAGTVSIPVVTIDVHMLETETGAAVWAATHTEKGAGLSAKLLGTGAEPISYTTRRCVQRIVRTLVR